MKEIEKKEWFFYYLPLSEHLKYVNYRKKIKDFAETYFRGSTEYRLSTESYFRENGEIAKTTNIYPRENLSYYGMLERFSYISLFEPPWFK